MKSLSSLILMSSIALSTVSVASETPDYRIELNCSARMELNGQTVEGSGYATVDSSERMPPADAYFEGEARLGSLVLNILNYSVQPSTGKDVETHNYYEIYLQSTGVKSDDIQVSYDMFAPIKIKENKTTGECLAYKNGDFFTYSLIKNERLGLSASHDIYCEIIRVSFHGKRCPVLNK